MESFWGHCGLIVLILTNFVKIFSYSEIFLMNFGQLLSHLGQIGDMLFAVILDSFWTFSESF